MAPVNIGRVRIRSLHNGSCARLVGRIYMGEGFNSPFKEADAWTNADTAVSRRRRSYGIA